MTVRWYFMHIISSNGHDKPGMLALSSWSLAERLQIAFLRSGRFRTQKLVVLPP